MNRIKKAVKLVSKLFYILYKLLVRILDSMFVFMLFSVYGVLNILLINNDKEFVNVS